MNDIARAVSRVSAGQAHVPAIDDLAAWAAQAAGGEIVRLDRLPGGNRRQAWAVDVRTGSGRGPHEYLLRFDPGGADDDDPYSIRREAVICRALFDAGVLLPEVVAAHPQAQAVLVRRIPGQADFRMVTAPSRRAAIARDFMGRLGELHAAEVDHHAFGEAAELDVTAAVSAELTRWEAMYRATGVADPLIEYALRWLAARVPRVPQPPVVVHGDTGPGNFLFEAGRVTAIIDWELAHLGDPMEDLAWLSLRAAQEGWPDFAASLRQYAAASRWPVEYERISYHRVFAELRVVIIRHRSRWSGRRGPAGELGNSLLSQGLHRRLCVEAMADASQVRLLPPPPLQAAADPCDWVMDAILEQLRRDVVPRISDPVAASRAKGVARGVKFLRSQRHLGASAERADVADLSGLLGHRVPTATAGQQLLAARIRNGPMNDGAVLSYLGRLMSRETELLADAMGALAARHHPPLPEADDRDPR
jgi:aminoglycoside phosphotransferase (APT) family kinase protein